MARYNDFDPEIVPILRFQPSSYVQYREGGRRYLLWPVYGYRVLAPRPTKKQLNIFQKAVLGFCRIGVNEPEQIASRLHLDREVIKFVQGELRRSGMLNLDNTPTSQGLDILSYELDRLPSEIVVGHVFQDPWQGKLWPRFIENLEYTQTEIDSDGRPTLIFGKEGKPRRYEPFVKYSDERVMPRTPTPIEIVRACSRHARDINQETFYEFEDPVNEEDDDEFDASSTEGSTRIDSISFISEKPELFFLTTFLYYPQGYVKSSDWYAYDPFGLGPSSLMRRWVDQQISRDHNLNNFIENFKKKCFGDSNEQDNLWSTFDQAAKDKVIVKLGDWICVYPFFDLLVAMERSYQEVISFKDTPPKDKLEDVLVKIGKALEGLFRFIHTEYPDTSAWEIYNLPDYSSRKSILDEIAAKLGYKTPIPNSLSRISPEDVRRSAQSGRGTMNERLVVALLAARRVTGHPLEVASTEIPDLFDRLAVVIRLRGQSAHETDLDLTMQLVEDQLAETYFVFKTLTSHIS